MTAWFLTYFGKIFKTMLIVSHQRPNVVLKDPLVIKLPQIHFYFQQCFPHLRISKWLLTTILQDDCRRIKSFFTLDRCHLLSFSHLQCFAEVEIVATSPQASQDGRLVQRQVSHHVELVGDQFDLLMPQRSINFDFPRQPASESDGATAQLQTFLWKHNGSLFHLKFIQGWAHFVFVKYVTNSIPSCYLVRRKLSTSRLANTSTVGSPTT